MNFIEKENFLFISFQKSFSFLEIIAWLCGFPSALPLLNQVHFIPLPVRSSFWDSIFRFEPFRIHRCHLSLFFFLLLPSSFPLFPSLSLSLSLQFRSTVHVSERLQRLPWKHMFLKRKRHDAALTRLTVASVRMRRIGASFGFELCTVSVCVRESERERQTKSAPDQLRGPVRHHYPIHTHTQSYKSLQHTTTAVNTHHARATAQEPKQKKSTFRLCRVCNTVRAPVRCSLPFSLSLSLSWFSV